MRSLSITPLSRPVKARISVPGSKSYTLRALLLAAMTPGKVKIVNPLDCDDTEAMLVCLKKLGISVRRNSTFIEVMGDVRDIKDKDYSLDADLSGITLRFMLALSCVIPGRQRIGGKAALNKRPVGDMADSLKGLGAKIEYLGKKGYPPLKISSSSLRGGKAVISGSESSQYLSALLMIAPLAGGLEVKIKDELGSKPYIDMTISAMEAFGAQVKAEGYHAFSVPEQAYKTNRYAVEGDVSSASYFFAIAALTESTVTVANLNPKSQQADMAFLKILERMGSRVTHGKDSITVAGKGAKALEADMGDCPDQAQTLAVLAAFASGKTVINGVKSLRVKETERVKALESELKKMGIKAESTNDSLTIRGGNPQGTAIDTYGDHRMAMSFAVAGAKLDGIRVNYPAVVAKTFPEFWDKLAALGIKTQATGYNVVLIGMRGTGKTTISRSLAKKLSMKQIDLDHIMSEKLSLSTPDIVAKHGWGYFRDQEAAIAKEISGMDGVLISTGGGIVLRPDNVEALRRNGVLVLLGASVETMVRRLEGSKNRPPLTDKKSLRAEVRQVRRERQHLYEAAADVVINTDNLTPAKAADRIIAKLEARP